MGKIRMKSKTSTISKTKLAVATAALLVAGGAAYGFGVIPGQVGYSNMYVKCHNGSRAQIDDGVHRSIISYRSDRRPERLAVEMPNGERCIPAKEMRDQAKEFCAETDSDSNFQGRKRGVNSYGISERCKITSQNWYVRFSQGSRK